MKTLKSALLIAFAVCLLAPANGAANDYEDGRGPTINSTGAPAIRLSAPAKTRITKSGSSYQFRTDSGPDLDFYQNCDGGDNVIEFTITISDVDITTISSARLTLAVWDVDYDCSGSPCERDTISLNGTPLTTPMPYLTGANDQWSTVSFEVDPLSLVSGDNLVHIDIDTLGGGWCVECDWGQLEIIADSNVPEIEEITVEPELPMTLHNVTLTAKIKEVEGYTINGVDWVITDVKTGSIDSAESSVNPYSFTPAEGLHGLKEASAYLTFTKDDTGEGDIDEKSKQFKIFFEKDVVSGGSPYWFQYWKRDTAVPGMTDFLYGTAGYGVFEPATGTLKLGQPAGGIHYPGGYTIGGITFGGAEGIDCAAEVCAHESYHKLVYDTMRGQPDADGDELPDDYETNTSMTKIDDPDTHNVAGIRGHASYGSYGDQEWMAMQAGDKKKGTVENDWANPGKQTVGAKTLLRSTLSKVRVTKSGTAPVPLYSDHATDTDGNGLFDELTISTAVEAPTAGWYALTGTLKGSGGEPVAETTALVELEAGWNIVDMTFAGQEVHHSKITGPYTYSYVFANEDGDAALSFPSIYQTSAYPLTQFEGAQASLTGQYADAGRDSNANSLFDSLDLTVGAVVSNAGTYTLGAFLYDGDGNPLLHAQTTNTLSVGTQDAVLSFPGLSLGMRQKNGPYQIRNVTLVDSEGNRVDYADQPGQTQSYAYTSFEGPAFFEGETTDRGSDTNADALFDSLDVTTPVNVRQAGQYALSGTLCDSTGAPIDVFSAGLTLDVGSHEVTLSFAGIKIARHAVQGPYQVRDIALHFGNTLGALKSNPYTTNAYAVSDFIAPTLMLTNTFSEEGYDETADDLYDQLIITVGAKIQVGGDYAVNARLMDKDGVEIDWASFSSYFATPGDITLPLSFSGAAILANGKSGPYFVRDLYVYSIYNVGINDGIQNAFTTKAYRWPNKNLPPIAQAGQDQTVVSACHTSDGTQVTLDASESSDPEDDTITYEWVGPFEGSPATDASVTVKLLDGCPGTYPITLVASDANGPSIPDQVLITVNPAPPRAEFQASQTLFSAQAEVSFSDLSQQGTLPITAWTWRLGDGSTSTESNPKHRYAQPGIYTVALKVSSGAGSDSAAKINYLKVTEAEPVVTFTASPEDGTAPLTVQFTDTTTPGTLPITGRSWQFGDGQTAQGESVSHTYTEPGDYTVTLTVNVQAQAYTAQKTVHVGQPVSIEGEGETEGEDTPAPTTLKQKLGCGSSDMPQEGWATDVLCLVGCTVVLLGQRRRASQSR